MENFKWDNKVDYSNPENLQRLIKEHQEFMENKVLKPKEEKLKEYENKINSYEEQQLFSTIKDPKKIELVKSLMNTDKYKDLPKEESFKAISEDYKDFIAEKQEEKKVEETTLNTGNLNAGKLILDLHNNSIDPLEYEKKLKEKAKTTGIIDSKEMENFIEMNKKEALDSIK